MLRVRINQGAAERGGLVQTTERVAIRLDPFWLGRIIDRQARPIKGSAAARVGGAFLPQQPR